MVGDASLTREIARKYGADGYADTAADVVQEAVRLVTMLREKQLKIGGLAS